MGGGRGGRKKQGWSDECWSGEMDGGARGKERMSEGMAQRKQKGGEGGRGGWPRVEERHGGWKEHSEGIMKRQVCHNG